jgi:hypothetical protein
VNSAAAGEAINGDLTVDIAILFPHYFNSSREIATVFRHGYQVQF